MGKGEIWRANRFEQQRILKYNKSLSIRDMFDHPEKIKSWAITRSDFYKDDNPLPQSWQGWASWETYKIIDWIKHYPELLESVNQEAFRLINTYDRSEQLATYIERLFYNFSTEWNSPGIFLSIVNSFFNDVSWHAVAAYFLREIEIEEGAP